MLKLLLQVLQLTDKEIAMRITSSGSTMAIYLYFASAYELVKRDVLSAELVKKQSHILKEATGIEPWAQGCWSVEWTIWTTPKSCCLTMTTYR